MSGIHLHRKLTHFATRRSLTPLRPIHSVVPVMRLHRLLFLLLALSISSGTADEFHPARTLVEMDASWRYHDGNKDLGSTWTQPDYDDSAWKQGHALLGYGPKDRKWPAPGLNTGLAPGFVTYYFRHTFEYDGPLDNLILRIDQIVDDAAVYYLNGVEIGRTSLVPDGTPSFETRAKGIINPSIENNAITIVPSALRKGRNVFAASVHNQSPDSSDICFGIRITVDDARRPQPPPGLLLTWQRDPTTTMTIDWHRRAHELSQPPVVEARPKGTERWTAFKATRLDFPNSDRKIDRVELTNLRPATEYEFRGGAGSPIYYFRTAPATLEKPLTFAIGGDTRHRQDWLEEMNRVAMKYNPEFVVWGGDLAYADGKLENVERWYEWFDANMKTLIAPDGRVLPILAAIGNHEVLGGAHQDRMKDHAARQKFAPFFYALLAFPGDPGYGVIDFGDYLSFVFGDSGHSNPITGKQTDWLKQTLAKRRSVPHLIPVYHVPGFPSHREYEKDNSREIREHWVPLFEANGVQVAFENDDHAFKRTVPIRRGKKDPSGIVYFGDGSWGVGPRPVHDPDHTWYLEKAKSVRHGMIVTLTPSGKRILALDNNGETLDELEIPLRK